MDKKKLKLPFACKSSCTLVGQLGWTTKSNEVEEANISQDALENSFGCVRYTKPSLNASLFRAAYGTAFVKNLNSTHSIKSNCEPDTSTTLLTDLKNFFLNYDNILNETASNDSGDDDDDTESAVFDPLHIFTNKDVDFITNETTSNAASAVCDKFLKIVKCANCQETIKNEEYGNGMLKRQYDVFNKNFSKLLNMVNPLLPDVCTEKLLRKNLSDKLNEIDIDVIGCSDHHDVLEAKLKEQVAMYSIVNFTKNINNLLNDVTEKKLTVARNRPQSKVHGKIDAQINLRDQKIIKIFGIDILDGCGQLKQVGYESTPKFKTKKKLPTKPTEMICNEPDYMFQHILSSTNSTFTSTATLATSVTLNPPHDVQSTFMVDRRHLNNSCASSHPFPSVQNLSEPPTASQNNTQVAGLNSYTNNIPSTSNQPLQATVSISQSKIAESANGSTVNIHHEEVQLDPNTSEPQRFRPQIIKKSNSRRQAVGRKRVQKKIMIHRLYVQWGNFVLNVEEVHPKRFVRPNRSSSSSNDSGRDDNAERCNRRRIRLSKPLGVLAEESLDLQKENNFLLRKILDELRNNGKLGSAKDEDGPYVN
ncbi:hypothetical protein Bhyg_15484 [Pseudolycoriella hygida]|uniref:Uncharacterized protein n=1 Tax=Pseudolycoriella hygida TaxID=35572 RepID=A0A9Q0RRZ3_9DIPT|nr:hypothetical protein Bhyg_15484 [Pseudolycoriella hygida]